MTSTINLAQLFAELADDQAIAEKAQEVLRRWDDPNNENALIADLIERLLCRIIALEFELKTLKAKP